MIDLARPYRVGLLSRVARIARRGLHRLGVDVIRHPSRHSFDWHLQLLFAKLGIDCVLDVGANRGQYAQLLRKIGYSGHILSFEPVPEAYSELQRVMAGDRRWRGFPFALGDRDGVAPLHVSGGTSEASSFLEMNEEGPKVWGDHHRELRSAEVQVRRLDSILDDLVRDLPAPRIYLKMDTQGYDLAVVEGARGVLDRILALQSEIAERAFYHGMTPLPEALARYLAMGFVFTGIFPGNRDEDHLRVFEFDCVMMRAGTLSRPL
jgi:FkbM family methyltransferase